MKAYQAIVQKHRDGWINMPVDTQLSHQIFNQLDLHFLDNSRAVFPGIEVEENLGQIRKQTDQRRP